MLDWGSCTPADSKEAMLITGLLTLITYIDFIISFTEDEQFNDEKTYLIKQIKELQPPANRNPMPAAATASS